MAVELQELRAVVRAEIEQFEERMNKAGKDAEVFESRFEGVGAGVARTATAITTAVVTIGTAMAAAAVKFIEAGEEQRQAVARLEAVFKATGHAAGVTTRQVLEFAAARQAVTNFGDEVTVQGAAVLATFKSIRGEAFMQTISLAQDMAELMGGDLQGAVLQLGKAMEDPEHGLMALRRAGISFNEEQKETIIALAQSNRLHEAQAMILQMVAGQIGGVAEAAQSPLTAFRNTVSDLAEDIGIALLPAFQEFSNDVTKFISENRPQIIALANSFMQFGLSITKFLATHPKLASFLGLLAVGKLTGINSAIGGLAGGVGNLSKGLGGLGSSGGAAVTSIRSIGMASMAAKAGLVGLALVGIAAVATAIYKVMPSIRAWNRETEKAGELNAKLADAFQERRDRMMKQADQFQDPQQRRAFLQQELETAQENLLGLESSLAGAKKQYDEYNTGWNSFTGNKVLADLESSVTDTSAALERQKALIKEIEGEIGTGGGGGGGFGMSMPEVETEDERKAREKSDKEGLKAQEQAIEKHADDMKSAAAEVRDFGDEIVSLRDKLSAAQMGKFSLAADDLKSQLDSGSISLDEFNYQMGKLDEQMNQAAHASESLQEFANGLNDLRDTLSPEVLDRAFEGGKELRRKLESGEITQDQFDTGLSTMNDQLSGAAAGQDFMKDAAGTTLEADSLLSFKTGVDELTQQLFGGQITLDQFNQRLGLMREELQAATMAQDAFDEFSKANESIPATAGVVEEFANKIAELQAQFNNGEISLDQYRRNLSQVTTQAEKAAAAAKQQALLKGDFAGAGLNFQKSVQQQFMEQAAAARQGQFDGAVNAMVQQMLRLNGFIDQTGSAFQGIGQSVSDLGDNLSGAAGDMKGMSEQAQKAAGTLSDVLASRQGQIVAMQNQIQTLQQFLTLESIGYRRRQEIINQIEQLAQQIIGLMQVSTPVLGDWRADPLFEDPGLEGASGGQRGTRGPSQVVVNSIFPPSAADRRMLMDVIVDELSRQGWR